MAKEQKSINYALKRQQAERNVKSHIDDILKRAATDIAKESRSFIIVSSVPLFKQLIEVRSKDIIERAESEINTYIREYSKASIAVLGDKDTGATGRLLNSELFGKTFGERSKAYMDYFLHDVINIILAGRKEKMRQADIEKAVVSQFKDPYVNGLIDKANKNGANIQMPHHGKGVYQSAYGNIVRNAQGTISVAWGREERNFERRNGAVGFYIHRGSNYPCEICQGEVEKGLHKMNEDSVPFHSRCQCWVEYVYKS